jgi:hypothetical protein
LIVTVTYIMEELSLWLILQEKVDLNFNKEWELKQ